MPKDPPPPTTLEAGGGTSALRSPQTGLASAPALRFLLKGSNPSPGCGSTFLPAQGLSRPKAPSCQIICSCLLRHKSGSGYCSCPEVGILGCCGFGKSLLPVPAAALPSPDLLLAGSLRLTWGQDFRRLIGTLRCSALPGTHPANPHLPQSLC